MNIKHIFFTSKSTTYPIIVVFVGMIITSYNYKAFASAVTKPAVLKVSAYVAPTCQVSNDDIKFEDGRENTKTGTGAVNVRCSTGIKYGVHISDQKGRMINSKGDKVSYDVYKIENSTTNSTVDVNDAVLIETATGTPQKLIVRTVMIDEIEPHQKQSQQEDSFVGSDTVKVEVIE